MSLRLIAKDLYRILKDVERLEKELAEATPAAREELRKRLARAITEREHLRRLLDGHLDR